LCRRQAEAFGQITFVTVVFTAPGTEASTVADLTPGEYIAVCFVPVGSTPEVMEEMMAAEDTAPGSTTETAATAAEAGGSVPAGTMDTAATAPESSASMDTAAAGTTTGDSAPAGEEELGPPHVVEGMYIEFTVVDGASGDPAATTATEMSDTTQAGDDTPDTTETTGEAASSTEMATETTAAG